MEAPAAQSLRSVRTTHSLITTRRTEFDGKVDLGFAPGGVRWGMENAKERISCDVLGSQQPVALRGGSIHGRRAASNMVSRRGSSAASMASSATTILPGTARRALHDRKAQPCRAHQASVAMHYGPSAMDIRQLQYLAALAREKHFTRASITRARCRPKCRPLLSMMARPMR